MARTTIVKAARKDQGSCQSPRCSHDDRAILAGTSYKWFKRKSQRGGVVFRYHADCYIPPSHRTTSRMGEIQDAQDNLSFPDQWEDDTQSLSAVAEEFAQVVRDVSEGYEESASNIEEGFGHETYQSQELRERAEALSSWANDIESVDLDEFEEPENTAHERVEQQQDESDEDYEVRVQEEHDAAVEEARQEWWDEQVQKVQDEIDNCPV